jgi:hypothetical protein
MNRTAAVQERTMEPILMSDSDLEEAHDGLNEQHVVHAWRTEQLQRLGLHRLLAETFADRIDWHAFAALVERGCTPTLALEIVRP